MQKIKLLLFFAICMFNVANTMNHGTKRTLDENHDAGKIVKRQKTDDDMPRARARERIKSRRAQGYQEAQVMEDDHPKSMVMERTLSAPKNHDSAVQELARNLEKFSDKRFWNNRKELVEKTFAVFPFNVKDFRYKQRGSHSSVLIDYNLVMDAVFNRDTEFLQWLLERGADANAVDACGVPVLFNANSYEMAQLLISYGAAKDCVDGMGESLSMNVPFRGMASRLIDLYGAQGCASASSNTPGGSPLIRLIDQVTHYKTEELAQAQDKARRLIFAGVDLNALITHGQYKGNTYSSYMQEKIKNALERKKKSVNHKHLYDQDIEKMSQLVVTIKQAIEEKNECEQRIQAAILGSLSMPLGIAQVMAEYAVTIPEI